MKRKLIFEWDARKAATNFQKHGISFEEATQIFGDPFAITIDDPDHGDDDEFREITIGQTGKLRMVVVSHVDRDGKMRIISARKASRNETAFYKEEI